MTPAHTFDALGFVVRWLMAFFLLLATYNPSGYSYYHWVIDPPTNDRLLQMIVGAFLVFCYFVAFDITRRALHTFGFVNVIIFCSLISWWIGREGWVDVERDSHLAMLVIGTISTILAIGMSYSHVHYRLGGVKQVEEV